jgi:1,2-dihydroxy-3-keto-5-methylthiopentene dioxygenase
VPENYLFHVPGYEDVRDFDGQWIRIEIKKGDLIVLPPGMYHRFTLDENLYLKVTCMLT